MSLLAEILIIVRRHPDIEHVIAAFFMEVILWTASHFLFTLAIGLDASTACIFI